VKTELIDRIYECSFVPELWPGVLDELAQLTESRGGLLFSARDRVLKWTASANLSDIFRSYVEDGWFPRCTRRVCLFGQSQPASSSSMISGRPTRSTTIRSIVTSFARTGSAVGRHRPADADRRSDRLGGGELWNLRRSAPCVLAFDGFKAR
jgi:hypothetical protein